MAAGNSTVLTEEDLKALEKILGIGTLRIVLDQRSETSLLNQFAGGAIPPARERRTPIVPEESGLRQEDWLAPLQASMKDARANLDLVAEEFVRLAAAGQVSYDTFDQQRKALDYLNGRSKENAELDAKIGKNAAVMRDAFAGVQRSMLVTTATLAATFASLRHMAGAANPGLLRAWDGAMAVAQARLANALLPEIDYTIDAIMNLSDWFAGLGDGTKKLIGGGVLAIPVLFGLTRAIRELKPAGEVAIAVMKRFADAAKGNSTIAAGGIAAGAAVAAAAAFWQLDRKAGPSSEEARGVGQNVGSVTVEEMRTLRFTDDQIAALTSKDERRRREAADAIVRQDYRRTEWQRLFHPEAYEDQKRAVQNVLERIEQPGAGAISKAEADWRQQVKRQAMRVSAVQQENKPSYSPIAEARKQLQLQILGKNQFEQQLLKEQRQTRLDEIKRLDELIRQGQERRFRIIGD